MKLRSSLSLKLWVIFITGTIALLLVIFLGISGGFKQHFARQVEPHINTYAEYMIQDIGTPPDYARATALANSLNAVIKIRSPKGMWSSDGNTSLPHWLQEQDNHHSQRGPFRLFKVEKGTHTFFFLPKPQHQHYDDYDDQPLFWIILSLAMLILWASYYFTTRQFKPIRTEIKAGLAAISQGDLSHRIRLSRQDEIGDLAKDINTMAEQLEKLLQSKQDLLLAVSHELRSPLTRITVSLAMLEHSDLRTSLQEDIHELEQTIANILDAQRLHSDHALLHREPTDIHQLIHAVLQQHFANQTVALNLADPLPIISVDGKRLALLLKNLLDNALRHNRLEHGPVSLSVVYQAEKLHFHVQDHGEGISAEHLDKLTTAFYRPDKSRARKTGGLGLGLYLCDGIAKAHGGKLRIKSQLGIGSTFSVSLPCGEHL